MTPAQYEALNSSLLDALDRVVSYHGWWSHESKTPHEKEMQRIAQEARKNYDVVYGSFVAFNEERSIQ